MGYPLIPRNPKRKFRGPDDSDKSRATSQPLRVLCRRVEIATTKPAGLVTVTDTQVNVPVGATISKSFSRNANWRQIVAREGNATYSYSRTDARCRPLTYRATNTLSAFANYVHYGQATGNLDIASMSTHLTLKDQALSKLKNKLNGHIGKTALLAPLAESKELHGLIRQGLHFTEDTLIAAINLRKTRGKSAAKHLGALWLAYSFGIRPMAADIAKAAEAVDSYFNNRDHRVRVSGTAQEEWFTSSTSDFDPGSGSSLLKITASGEHRGSFRYIAVAKLSLQSAEDYTLARHLGLDLSQVPSTLWELTAFSWVVDYFSTVGQWLDDVFFTLPGVIQYAMLNTRYELKTSWGGKWSNVSSGEVGPGAFHYFSFQRELLSSLPYRQLRLRTVDEVGKFALSKVLNLASVYAVLMRK